MSLNTLQNWLVHNAGFRKQYQPLLADSVAQQFPLDGVDVHESINWAYLLFSGSLMASSGDGVCQDVSLRIAQYCLSVNKTSELQKDAAAIILQNLSNNPAIELAIQRELLQPHFAKRLGVLGRMQWTKRFLENSVLVGDDYVQVNRFQKTFWEAAKSANWISASAPTSAGKSYIVTQWLRHLMEAKPGFVAVYLVPTRALIHQVETDLRAHLPEAWISSLPLHDQTHHRRSGVFVFTQERLHIYLSSDSSPDLDVLIVDEAQKVGDGTRGVLLEQAIERLVMQCPSIRVLFASPLTENPQILLENPPLNTTTRPVVSDDVTVNQNLLWARPCIRSSTKWTLSLIDGNEELALGSFELEFKPTPESKRLPFVAHAIGDQLGGNLIYVNTASAAEKAAEQLFDLLGPERNLNHEAIDDLIELVKKTIHPRYSLAKVLSRGIAFHYGNMPLLIRTEIEKLFRDEKLRYLACTSTLVEGVNLPCRTLFVRGPKRGMKNKMSIEDFWNLAGRAGRWGKEFQGNVVCVDPQRTQLWQDGKPPRKRAKQRIHRTSDDVLGTTKRLIDYIQNAATTLDVPKDKDCEYVLSYLSSLRVQYGNLVAAPSMERFPAPVLEQLDQALSPIIDNMGPLLDVIVRNPGINPLGIKRLYEYFENRKKPIEDLLPVPPETEDSALRYTEVFGRINKTIAKVFGSSKLSFIRAILVVSWMRGVPLSRLIADRIKHRPDEALSTNIRSTLDDVETIARFLAPKYLACYSDVLRVHLIEKEREDLTSQLDDLWILLEFGVSQQTQLSLMGLGLSRTAAIAVSEIIAADDLDQDACFKWLTDHIDQINDGDLMKLVKTEVATLLAIAK